MSWFGRKFPSQDDLEETAWGLGAVVVYGAVPTAFCCMHAEGPIIGLPVDAGVLEKAWLLAHEIGHLKWHVGPRGVMLYGKDERQANEWAAAALLPLARLKSYRSASIDSFIAALSRNYEEIPCVDCVQRRLAGFVSGIRMDVLHRGAYEKSAGQ